MRFPSYQKHDIFRSRRQEDKNLEVLRQQGNLLTQAWESDTLYGHAHNVSCVIFNKNLNVLISNGSYFHLAKTRPSVCGILTPVALSKLLRKRMNATGYYLLTPNRTFSQRVPISVPCSLTSKGKESTMSQWIKMCFTYTKTLCRCKTPRMASIACSLRSAKSKF